MRKHLRWGDLINLAVVFLAVAASGSAQDLSDEERSLHRKAESARKYLQEVYRHLTESFIGKDKIEASGLVQAAAEGIVAALVQQKLPPAQADALSKELEQSVPESIEECVSNVKRLLLEYKAFDVDPISLADGAAWKMLEKAGDPYCQILKAEDLGKLIRMLFGQGSDEAVGLSVEPAEGHYRVAYVMYGFPAYRAGIEMEDELLEVDSVPVAGLKPVEVAELLKLKGGKALKLTIRRESLLRPYRITVSRGRGRPKDVLYEILPGGIGYVRITLFDLNVGRQMDLAFGKLREAGVRSIILDLRSNPGGALVSAVAAADRFVPGRQLITNTESDYEVELPFKFPGLDLGLDQKEFYSGKPNPFERLPLVVLVNRASASASELLAGALQDHKRGVLVGERTYGKGVGQAAIPLWNTSAAEFGKGLLPFLPKRFLYLTVLRYYLPTGRSIDKVGIQPDVELPLSKLTGEEFDQVWQLRQSGKLEAYIAEHLAGRKKLARKLARYDRFDPEKYPNFSAWYDGLQTPLSRDRVRSELRRTLRAWIEDEQDGPQFLTDIQEDTQLQQAILELRQ